MAVLLENALSEELPPQQRPRSPPPPPLPLDHDRIPSSTLPPPATDKDKMLAACVGAIVTSLTMTPFDVIKTRLQTAPSPAHSSHPTAFTAPPPSAVPPPSHLPKTHPYSHPQHTPFPPPVASTSSAPPPAQAQAGSFFASNSAAATPAAERSSLWSRFDPRVARASLPSAGAHGALSACSSAPAPSSAAAATAALHLPSYSSSSAPSSLHRIYRPTAATINTTLLSPHPSAHAYPPTQATSFVPLVRQILTHEGPTALWRGTAPALLMSVPGQVIYMLGYDWGRRTAFSHAPEWARKEGREGGLKAGYVTAVPLVAGAASRTVVAALLSPFELIRTQLQSQSRHPHSLVRLLRDLELSTAWRGLGPTLWRDVPFSAVYWAGYEGVKRGLTGGRGMGERASVSGVKGGVGEESLAERWGLGEFGVAFVSGAGSGMLAATLTNPFDVIKTRRQALSSSSSSASSASSASTATLAILRQTTREEGVKGWFRGLTPRLAKVGPACGLMIGCYEALSSFSSASRARKDASSARDSIAE
ncbi:hypothetical protein JCM11251_003962 [Rhodosporidiobolus azoricus]